MTEFNQACPCCCAGGISVERELELQALLRRDWSVRVLDAWWRGVPEREWFTTHRAVPAKTLGNWACVAGGVYHVGPTPDAARHAAALAVYPALDADVRAKLGECP